MKQLIQMFATDAFQAKTFYYISKLKQDVTTPEGTVFKRKMLMNYTKYVCVSPDKDLNNISYLLNSSLREGFWGFGVLGF
jgi:hypothetical protein